MLLYDWKARRAGGRITIYGKAAGGDAARIVGVDVIEPRAGRIVAVDKDGEEHELKA